MKLSVVSVLFLSTLGCGTGLDVGGASPAGDVSSVEGEIIGGTTLEPDIETRRRLGLVDVGDGCSGALLSRDWVITATHCLDRDTISNNRFGIPRVPPGLVEIRRAAFMTVLGPSDISLVRLEPAPEGSSWPNVTRTIATVDSSSLVGNNLRCLGRGNSVYKNPGPGVDGFGVWRQLNKPVARIVTNPNAGVMAVVDADSDGQKIYAFGDSGGPCLSGSNLVAVISRSSADCTDLFSNSTCEQTTTKITNTSVALTSSYADYINETVKGSVRAQFFPIALPKMSDWHQVNASFGLPEYALPDNGFMVQLRGKISSSSASTSLFQLPVAARPNRVVYVPVFAEANGRPAQARLVIAADGTTSLAFEGGVTAPTPWSVTLDGVQFVSELGARNTAPIALQNRWLGGLFSTAAPAAVKANDTVFLMGAIVNSSSTANKLAMTLPAGSRPSSTIYVHVDMFMGAKGRLIISPDGSITLQAEGDFRNATRFTSLEGVSFPLNSNNTNVTYENGWKTATYGNGQVQYKNDGGILRFQGAAGTGTSPRVFTLPAALRPATPQTFWIDGCASAKLFASVQPTGSVFASGTTSSFDSCFTSFEGGSIGL